MRQMSACGAADRTARCPVPEPPRWTIRRTAALAASLLLVVVVGVPAWAGASIAPTEVEADTEAALTLTVTEPTEEAAEAYGDTARVVVGAPTGFTILGCESGLDWGCAVSEDGTRVTFNRMVVLDTSYELQFTVHTATVNGPYAFRVTQADGPPAEEGEDPPTTITSRPAVTVKNGKDPAPEPTPPADDGGGSQDGGATDDRATDGNGSGDSGTPSQASDDDPPASGSAQDTDSDDSGSTSGSTAPRRTQERATGTTLEITPGEPTDDDPAIAPPAVADDPAVAAPSGTQRDDGSTSESTTAAAAGTQPSDQPGSGTPWQQWVGAAMLLAGLATVGVRWFRQRRSG